MPFIRRIFASWKTGSANPTPSQEPRSSSSPTQAKPLEHVLVVGLGNPGDEYEATRHNAGFFLLDTLATDWSRDKTSKSLIARQTRHGYTVTFAKPQTFMNLSGIAVRTLADRLQIPPNGIIILHDDIDLPFGDVRTKFGGGTAGHNGLKSIVEQLGTEAFWRIRFGIGRPANPQFPIDRYVLQTFSESERSLLQNHVSHAVEQLERLLAEHRL